MIFVETSCFSKLLYEYLSDDEYRRLQAHLVEHPDAGAIIRGSGGVRKVRWAAGDKGKSGGVRVIYYWFKADEQIFSLRSMSKVNRKT